MELNILHEVAALQCLTIGQLRQRFAEVFGEATAASNRIWLVKRLAWRLQALAEGDLSGRARRRAQELAGDADLRLNPPRPKTCTPPEPEAVVAPMPAATVKRRLFFPFSDNWISRWDDLLLCRQRQLDFPMRRWRRLRAPLRRR
ncbi:MAG TPA: DUF2924 domain-containing protein, partial [Gemmataceae bacterium]|nr:DUF2924 domain-containing protein [Gemmataceae bacterium]